MDVQYILLETKKHLLEIRPFSLNGEWMTQTKNKKLKFTFINELNSPQEQTQEEIVARRTERRNFAAVDSQ